MLFIHWLSFFPIKGVRNFICIFVPLLRRTFANINELLNGSFTFAKFLSETVSDTRHPHDRTCLGHLGQRDTDRLGPFMSRHPIWPRKVRKARYRGKFRQCKWILIVRMIARSFVYTRSVIFSRRAKIVWIKINKDLGNKSGQKKKKFISTNVFAFFSPTDILCHRLSKSSRLLKARLAVLQLENV